MDEEYQKLILGSIKRKKEEGERERNPNIDGGMHLEDEEDTGQGSSIPK